VNIFIDESGSFASTTERESWSVVAAIASAESSRRAIDNAVGMVRRNAGAYPNEEVKLNRISEHDLLKFLGALDSEGIVVFATATDAGLNSPDRIARHQSLQVQNIRENISRMRYEGGRTGVALLANQMEALPHQLYVQLVCQTHLLHDIVGRAVNYFAQRNPATLGEFRWRIDQKDTSKTVYEDAFEKIAPALLQTRSFSEPLERVKGFNYSHFSAYEYEDGKMPDYLQTEYGLPPMEAINVQKLIRGNLAFQDSKASNGIQVADLVASGLRRVLRRSFDNSDAVAEALGRLTLQNKHQRPSINLISFSEVENETSEHVARMARLMSKTCRPMIKRDRFLA
jgi:hypothetical protein